jgi:hypothetical protein
VFALQVVALKDVRIAIDVDWIWELSGDLFDCFLCVTNAPKQPEEFGMGDSNPLRHGSFSFFIRAFGALLSAGRLCPRVGVPNIIAASN